MKIESKFDVHSLVVYKFQKSVFDQKQKNDLLVCFEVMEVITHSCYSGTQIWYDLRPIHGIKSTDWVDKKEVIRWTDFVVGMPRDREYMRMREDEMIDAPKELVDLILGNC